VQHPPIGSKEDGAWQATRSVRRAGNAAGTTSLLFLILFVVSAQVPAIRATSAWAEDPYDAVLSIAFLVLPVVMVIGWVRARRWRGPHPTPPAALRQQLRGATVAASLVVASVVACLAALLAAAVAPVTGSATSLDMGETPPLVGLLLIGVTGTACLALGVVARAWRQTRSYLESPGADPAPDVFDDVEALTVDLARASSAPPTVQHLGHAAGRATHRLARPMRAHPWPACFAIAIAFGVGLSTWHSVVEGVPSLSAALFIVPVYAGLGAAIVVGAYATVGRYLELIRHQSP
jgi:hypothetical protein